MAERVLIVEDEQHIADGLRFNLEAEGYSVRTVDTGEAALELLVGPSGEVFDAVVLDVMLPVKDGFAVVSELRQAGQFVPTLMLTARGRPEEILEGLDAGADDYLPKPFELSILIARLRGMLRRKRWLTSETPPLHTELYSFGECSIDFAALQVNAGNQTYSLTSMEASVLRYLIEREGKNVSRKTLLAEVWGLREDTDTRAIDNFIVRLRRYLERDPAHPRHLVTVRGVGYRFVAAPEG